MAHVAETKFTRVQLLKFLDLFKDCSDVYWETAKDMVKCLGEGGPGNELSYQRKFRNYLISTFHEDLVYKAFYILPLRDMPTLINDDYPIIQAIAKWRLEIGV